MPNEPKLEIFKIILENKEDGQKATYRKLFRKKLGPWKNDVTAEDIFRSFHADFIKKFTGEGYSVSNKKNKAYSIVTELVDGIEKSKITSPFTKDWIIQGILKGGTHKRKRSLGEITNTKKETTIHEHNIVNDHFYFLIHVLLEHNVAIVMVQGYTEIKISDVFKDYLLDYFSFDKEIKSEAQYYVPGYLKDKYLEKAKFRSLKFTTDWEVNVGFEDLENKNYDIQISIEIIDKSKKKSEKNIAAKLLQAFGQSKIAIGSKNDLLNSFRKKSAKMESEGKEFPIDFDDEDNIKPVIKLYEHGIKDTGGGIPDFEQIDKYCRGILPAIVSETLPSNAVKNI